MRSHCGHKLNATTRSCKWQRPQGILPCQTNYSIQLRCEETRTFNSLRSGMIGIDHIGFLTKTKVSNELLQA
jgi:hypothetical protein